MKNKQFIDETWSQKYWRPGMAFAYMAIILFDFIFAPIMMVVYSVYTKSDYIAWASLTLSNGGLFHLAMGAILGVTAWTKGQENIQKIVGTNAQFTRDVSPVSSDTQPDDQPGQADPPTTKQTGPTPVKYGD